MGKMIYLRPIGTVNTVEIDESDMLHELQRLVGGYIETVPVPDTPDLIGIVNESGLINGMAINPLASTYLGQPIFGPVVIARHGFNEDGEPDILCFPDEVSRLFNDEEMEL